MAPSAPPIPPPAWLVLPLLVWSRWQLSCLEACEELSQSWAQA
ncbi:MAG: hypothetical protein U0931_29585 [Vulcanimicrobiota bacterium]